MQCEKRNNVNYVISARDRRKKRKFVHINRLKTYDNRDFKKKIMNAVDFCSEAENSDFEANPREVALRNSEILCNMCA